MPLKRVRVAAAVSALVWALLDAGPAKAEAPPTQCAPAYERAQLLRQRGKLLDARDAALVCARPVCPDVARKDCTSWVLEIEREIPTVVVIARDDADRDAPGARVLVDGELRPEAGAGRPFELDPGAHVFRVERAGDEPVEQTVLVVQGERDRIVRTALHALVPAPGPRAIAPSPAPSAARPQEASFAPLLPAVIVGSASLAAFATSAYLGLTGRSELSALRTTCAPTCTDEQVDPVRRRLLVSDVALGAAILGSAITIYLFAHPPSRSPAPPRLELTPTRAGATLFVHTEF